jgi:hypothetical protein
VGKNGSNGNSCSDCQNKLTPVKLYAPEILRMFSGGSKSYSKHGILTDFSICLNRMCGEGRKNIESYERVIESGMVRTE